MNSQSVTLVRTEEELTPNKRKALTPAPRDRKVYEEFLRQPDTGIFRLLRVTFGVGKVVRADNPANAMPVYLLVAFRGVRQDTNESPIVIWKKLKSYKAPKLKKEPKK